MICEFCQHRTATACVRRIMNGVMEELYLCEDCMKEEGIAPSAGTPISLPLAQGFAGLGMSDLFSGLLGAALTQEPRPAPCVKRCAFCGASLKEITQSGRVGCALCYETFREQLEPTLQRIHGALQHTGARPVVHPEAEARKQKAHHMKQLKEELQAAIREERYETAAQLRDELRALEKGGSQNE